MCAGTMLFGEGTFTEEAYRLLSAAEECGINFFDSAEMYPVPQSAATQGASERILGAWLRKRRRCELLHSDCAHMLLTGYLVQSLTPLRPSPLQAARGPAAAQGGLCCRDQGDWAVRANGLDSWRAGCAGPQGDSSRGRWQPLPPADGLHRPVPAALAR